MRILVLNADYPRFLVWLYRRQPGLENAAYATQMAARNASLFGVADFYSRNFSASGHPAAEIHVNNPWLQSAWAREHGMSVETPEAPGAAAPRALPAWLQRAVTPFKPLLRPLARKIGLSPTLDAEAENILLAQIEEFRPDLIVNQDTFHVNTGLVRRIKGIGRPILIGQVGIEPSRGEDWPVYDLMMSQLSSTVNFFRKLGVRAGNTGELALNKGDFAFAAKIYGEALKKFPEDADTHFGLARAFQPSDRSRAAARAPALLMPYGPLAGRRRCERDSRRRAERRGPPLRAQRCLQ